ncbi:MAG TPA: PAS domain-containing sensor histidine kinase, partial [Polyangiaceae bacterium]|nr:PAS domain-containing sensor histidine kinase [Polyangiaceae bacterium]
AFGRAVGALAMLDGLGALGEYALGKDLHFDRHVFGRGVVEAGGLYPGMLSIDAAVAFVLLGVALLASTPRRPHFVRDALALGAGTIAGVVALGYAYGATSLYGVAPFAMALPTAIAICILAIGVVLEDPQGGLLRMLVHGTVGGAMARRLVPVTLLLPIALSLVLVILGPHDLKLGAALLVAALGIIFTAVVLWNASALERSGESLRAERARLETILTCAPHGIIFVDAVEGRVENNPAAQRMTGYPAVTNRTDDLRADLVRRPDGTPIPRDEWPGERALRGESVSRLEARIIRSDGTPLPVLMSATPIRGPAGEVTGAVMAFEDITVFKELDRLRDEFASIVAHDLRNPISSILMNSELLLRQAEGRDAIHVGTAALERIRRAAARLGDMVKDLLDASRIEVDRLSLDRKLLPPRTTVEAIVEEVRPTLGEHPVKVATEGEPAPILADPVRFDQILTNLLENAAKYSPRDAPIDVKVAPSADGVEVSVKDEGMGIAPEEVPRLFDRFYQAKRAREMRAGLGLGLYIVHGLVAAHGGRIWVDSEPAHGSTFHVWLPSAHAAERH